MNTVFDKKEKLPFKELFSFFSNNLPVSFKNQFENEKVILFLRAHPATQIPWILSAAFLFFLIFFGSIFLQNSFSIIDLKQIFFINMISYSLLFSYVFINLMNWIFNIGIVSNKRVIDIDFDGFLCRVVSSASLQKIEEITIRNTGFFSSIFDYGNVFVQTAGSEQNVEFLNIPKSAEVQDTINNLIKRR